MKTAMQELVLKLPNEFIFDNPSIILEALKKEKEQIIKAHIDGFDHIVVDFKKQEYAEQYYNETYNQNEWKVK
jgi:hypothetical protein